MHKHKKSYFKQNLKHMENWGRLLNNTWLNTQKILQIAVKR